MAPRFLCLGTLAVLASPGSAPPAELDADRVFGQVMKSQAVVVVSTADGPRVSPATCLDRDRGLFLADLDAVLNGEKAALVLPRYDKAGRLVAARDDYLKWAAGQVPVPADKCVAHRDAKRCLAVLKFPDLPPAVRPLSLAAAVAKGEPALCLVVSRKIGVMWGAMRADPHELLPPSKQAADPKGAAGSPAMWLQSQKWGFGDSPGQAFVNANCELLGVRLSDQLGLRRGTNDYAVLDVREVAAMLKDAGITLPKASLPKE